MTTLHDKAKKIRLLILDVDGVLTDGTLCYSKEGITLKPFHVHDGVGLQLLKKTGIEIAIITAKESDVVHRRMQDLQITHLYQGQKNKLIAYEDLKQKLQLRDEEIAYIGDDLPDLIVLTRVGFSMTVASGHALVKQKVDWVLNTHGGQGAVREACDFILQAQGAWDSVIQSYLQG